jgi:hypothetical protein
MRQIVLVYLPTQVESAPVLLNSKVVLDIQGSISAFVVLSEVETSFGVDIDTHLDLRDTRQGKGSDLPSIEGDIAALVGFLVINNHTST